MRHKDEWIPASILYSTKQVTWLLNFYFDLPPAATRFRRLLLVYLIYNTHKERRNTLVCLSALGAGAWMTFYQARFQIGASDFPRRLPSCQSTHLVLKTYRFTFTQHRVSAILDLARGNKLKTFAAHFLSEPVEDSGIDGRLCQAHPFL